MGAALQIYDVFSLYIDDNVIIRDIRQEPFSPVGVLYVQLVL
jgi:hypothetical protein